MTALNNKNRRRFLKIVGLASIGAITGTALVKLTKENTLKKVTWRGIALGSPAEITIYHSNQKEAENILNDSYKKLIQLENLFSLYKENSQLSALNKNGYLKNPHPDMIELLDLSDDINSELNSVFKATLDTAMQQRSRTLSFFADELTIVPSLSCLANLRQNEPDGGGDHGTMRVHVCGPRM